MPCGQQPPQNHRGETGRHRFSQAGEAEMDAYFLECPSIQGHQQLCPENKWATHPSRYVRAKAHLQADSRLDHGDKQATKVAINTSIALLNPLYSHD